MSDRDPPAAPPDPESAPAAPERAPPARRDAFAVFEEMTTRWRDNDVYGHMNNVVFYEYVDSCVNGWLLREGLLTLGGASPIGLVVQSACVFHESVGFPDRLTTGLRAARIGTSSVTYEIGIFRAAAETAAAEARFTHVYVDRETRRPAPLGPAMRAALAAIRGGG